MENLQETDFFGDSENERQSQMSMADFTPLSSEEDYGVMVTRSTRRSTKSSPGRRKKQGRKLRKERHVIQHDYHDHAFDPVDFDDYVLDCDPGCALKKKGGVGTPFPLKLHELLEKAEEEGLSEIVSWQPHGRAFVVHKPKEFVAGIMHRFFRQTKLTSFQRQLNLYGFNRLTKGSDSGGYYHELFVRGRPHLTKRMVRTKIKGTGFKAASNPACEPDFYHMAPVDSPRPPMIGSTPIGATISNDDELPFVSPNDISFPTRTGKQLPSLSALFDARSCDNKNPRAPGGHKPFLGKRINPKRVKLGNQSFQYMEHMEPPEPLPVVSSEDGVSRHTSTSSDEQNHMIAISPTIFDSSFYDESTHTEFDSLPKEVDPLSVFLAEIGNDFEDDINFGAGNTVAEV
jgi:hypothetical protein